MIRRYLETLIRKRMKDRRAIIIYGPRQSGKSTLLKDLSKEWGADVLWLDGDDAETRITLSQPDFRRLKNIVTGYRYVLLDEAQRFDNTGLLIKILVDRFPGIKVLATGSSAYYLSDQVKEPLTGRKWEFPLFALSFGELAAYHGFIEEKSLLEQRMLYGMYPEVVNHPEDAEGIISEIADSYLYKDVLMMENIKKPEKLEKLVKALALQVSSEVSYNELAQVCNMDKETVEKYISLLERAFVIFRLPSLGKNVRNELKKSRKVYFWDNGIRNAVIGQFGHIDLRNDKGALWENYMISERMKLLAYFRKDTRSYFWRTRQQQEIDYVEETGDTYHLYEFKWSSRKPGNFSATFTRNYKTGETRTIHRENFDEFLMPSFTGV